MSRADGRLNTTDLAELKARHWGEGDIPEHHRGHPCDACRLLLTFATDELSGPMGFEVEADNARMAFAALKEPVPAEDAEPLPAGHPDTWPGGTMHMPAQPAAPKPSSAMNSAEDMQAVADEAAARLPQYGDAAKHREVCSLPECHEASRLRPPGVPMTSLLTFVLTHRLSRWLLARLRRPTPSDLARLSDEQFEAYIVAIGFAARIDAAMAQHRRRSGCPERLTPLQREVETEPSCTRCGQPITRLGDLYRCAQCHAAFDLACIHKHFDWSVNPNPHVRQGDTP